MTAKITFGRTLEKLRVKKGWTQEKLALEADIARRFLQDIEAGQKQPTITTLYKLSKAMHMKPGELLDTSWKEWLKVNKD
jgi:transcriptional regulator with XRE-family HTH domain